MFDRKEYYIKNREKILERIKQNCDKKKEYDKQYYKRNSKKIKELNGIYRKNNPDIMKKFKKNNPNYGKKWQKNRRKTDKKFNVSCRVGTAIRQSLKGNKSGHHWEKLMRYTLIDLIKHLKKTLPEGYTWQDYIEGRLHVDHIIPISVWNFTKPEHINFQRCWALSNLRLLPAKENQRKSNKLFRPFQPALQI